MSEHVLDWIGPYHDGELPDGQRQRVEAHLRTCAVCQAELAALQRLSVRLQASRPMPGRTPPEQFVAQVRLRLAPRTVPTSGRERLRLAVGLWLPLGVLALWALAQAVLVVGGLLVTVLWAASAPPPVGAVELFVLNLLLTGVAAGLVCGSLATWWAARDSNLALPGQQAGL